MCLSVSLNNSSVAFIENGSLESITKPLLKQRNEVDTPSVGAAGIPSHPLVKEEGWSLHHKIIEEFKALSRISGPTAITGLLIYVRNLVSMIFLGHLGQIELAAGSLAIGFANITGYSVVFGLAMGMEPICGQAYGAQRWTLLSITLHRTVTILLFTCLPISLLWLRVDSILLYLGQDETITKLAKLYLFYAIPDLILQALLHPIRIYLRTQGVTRPIAICSIIASLVHAPLNYYLVIILQTGIRGVALAVVLSNIYLLILLIGYTKFSGVCIKTWARISLECMKEWKPYLSLAIPSCISICLEWWWYEFMIILCGLMSNPKETVSSVGILIQLTSLTYVFPSSLSYGVSTRVAHELGAGCANGARIAAAVGAGCGAVTGLIAMCFALWASRWWGQMFTDGPGVLKLTAMALPIVGICELGNCPQTVMCGVLRGSARTELGAQVNIAGFYMVGLPVALVMGFWFKFGFVGLWLGLLGAQLTCAVVLGVVLAKTDWSAQVKKAEEITGKVVVEGDDYDMEKLWLMKDEDEKKRMVGP